MDSGSPLVCKSTSSGRFKLVGLVSLGTSCAQHQNPTLFTNVARHSGWIDEKTTKRRRRR